jgi:hypothetical protein
LYLYLSWPWESAKSARGRTGEPVVMRKASGKLGSKPSGVDSYSFMDELTESQQLQKRLRDIVHELKATVELLEQNLQEAHNSTHSRQEVMDGAGRKSDPAGQRK